MSFFGSLRVSAAPREPSCFTEPTTTLALDSGALIGTRNRRKPAVWNAEAADVFFIKGDPRIRRIFQRDASGRITGFVERRESWDVIWDRLGR